jgi:hypothetical protein
MDKQGRGVCDAHELLIDSIKELKDSQKDMINEIKTLNRYVIGKQAENGVTTIIAQKQDTREDSRLRNAIQIVMVIIAISAIIVGVLH